MKRKGKGELEINGCKEKVDLQKKCKEMNVGVRKKWKEESGHTEMDKWEKQMHFNHNRETADCSVF